MMTQRTCDDDARIKAVEEATTAEEMAALNPEFWDFIPNEAVMEKLIIRMSQIIDIEKDLWVGIQIS